MKTKLFKAILGIILATISPFFVLSIIGIFYTLFGIIRGVTFTVGIQSFINLIFNLRPFFPYLTTIPVIMVLIMLFMKNREKLLSLLKK